MNNEIVRRLIDLRMKIEDTFDEAIADIKAISTSEEDPRNQEPTQTMKQAYENK